MDDRRLALTPLREAGRSVLARSSKLLFGLGMAAGLPETTFGARKNKGSEDDEETKKEERREAKSEENGHDDENRGGTKAEDSKKSDNKATDEGQESNDRSERRERRDDRSENNDESVDDESQNTERRSVTRKQEAESDESDDGGRNGRRTEELAQNRNRDDEPNVDEPVDDVPTTPVAPSNPNVPVTTVPDPTDADLFIEANPDVIASVSTNGGFAFARSGNVIAVTGPDGAQIIQSDDPDAVVTPSPSPGSPSPEVPADDGGNNDVDFTS